ncbi:PAS domain-containing protein [Paracoccus sp. Z118]|uniref:PAS domain-containing sensor histidine kinase n=1 Tax=Paracoccus sp. Z118 TaxID=2851017 RepID=UPI001C2B9159|nr:PAS domain-containing sensor histidine kinase [Paracoccus sp. Z118]MBV0891461.1 PAS domain-containing protein [Paracoccus sp. Z118]
MPVPPLFSHGGSSGAHLRAFDWTDHPLGPPEFWDPALMAAVNTMLGSPESMYLVWGEARWFFHNDAYLPALGPRVSQATGTTLPALWADAWPAVEGMVTRGFRGEGSSVRDYAIEMARFGQPERTWWTFSYTPIRDAAGRVLGLQCITNETTEAVATAARLKRSEAYWQKLFASIQEPLIVGEMVHEENGRIEDWRIVDYNPAWARLMSDPGLDLRGKRLRKTFPMVSADWIGRAARVVESGRSVSFTRQFGSTGGWYDGVVQPMGDGQFVILFTDVTERVQSEQKMAEQDERRRMAAEIGQVGLWEMDLRTGELAWDRTTRQVFGVGEDREPQQADMRAAIHPEDREEFERRLAEATGTDCVFEMQFRAIGMDDGVERWASMKGIIIRDGDRPVRLLGAARDITEQVLSERRRMTLNQELAHRLKNTLAVVGAIVSQTLRGADDLESARHSTMARIRALASAHDVVMSGHKNAASIRTIVMGAIRIHDEGGRIACEGPDLTLGSKTSLTLSLILHELATNAAKYGALSTAGGRVKVAWSIQRGSSRQPPMLAFSWTEQGGPPVTAPEQEGFGTQLIRMGLSETGTGSVKFDYAPAGVQCHLTAPLAEVLNAGEEPEERA